MRMVGLEQVAQSEKQWMPHLWGEFKVRLNRLWATWSVERCPCPSPPNPCYECVFLVLVCTEILFFFFLSAYYCGSTSILINKTEIVKFFYFFFSVEKTMSGRTSSSSHVSVSVPETSSILFWGCGYPRVFWCVCTTKLILHGSNFCFVGKCFLGKLLIVIAVNTNVYCCISINPL